MPTCNFLHTKISFIASGSNFYLKVYFKIFILISSRYWIKSEITYISTLFLSLFAFYVFFHFFYFKGLLSYLNLNCVLIDSR